jgi:hypothetical protein
MYFRYLDFSRRTGTPPSPEHIRTGRPHPFPHAPGEGTDRHVADHYRVDPAHRRRLAVGDQQSLLIDFERQLAGRQDAAEGGEQVEGMALGIEGGVGHLRNAPDAQLVEGAHGCFQVLAAAALDRVTGQAAGDDRVAGVLIAHRADGVVGADLFTDAATAAIVLDRMRLADHRHGTEPLLRLGQVAFREDHAPALHLRFDGPEGAGGNARAAESAAAGIVADFPGQVVGGDVMDFHCFHR